MTTDVNETAPPEAGSEEYNAQMIAAADGPVETSELPPAEKPEAVPDKFWKAEEGVVDYEAWGKSTTELEGKLTTDKQKAAEEPPAEPEGEADPSAPGVIPQESFARYTQEFTEGGELTPESYEELAKVGIPSELVDTYVEGLKALQASSEATTLSQAGFADRDSFNAASNWAKVNLSPDEIGIFNEAMESNDSTVVTAALTDLQKAYSTAKGTTSTTLLNGEHGSAESGGYASAHEMTTAMSDPRYAKDPAYRNQVMQKVALSNI